MAALQLSVSAAAAKRSLPSLQGICRLPPTSRVSPVRAHLFPRKIDTRKIPFPMCLNGRSTITPGFDANSAVNYTEDKSEQKAGEPMKSYATVDNEGIEQPRKGAKIHDFCLGIPFGGVVFGGGLVGFAFSRNPASLTTGVLLGGVIMSLGFFSLKVWRKGRSSLPFILGQGAIAAALLWNHFRLYSSTKKLFPSGFYSFISAAMLCFYSYVLISGGNPPPKKKAAATSSLQ